MSKELATPNILLYGTIGSDISGKDIANQIYDLDNQGYKSCNIRIVSGGGNVLDGMMIYNAIRNVKMKVNTYNDYMSASIAGVILLAGDKINCASNSLFMMHNPSMPITDPKDLEVLENIKQTLVQTFVERTGKDATEVSDLMNRTTWLNANEMLEGKMCDEIYSSYRFKDVVNIDETVNDYDNDKLMMITNKIISNKKMEENKMKDLENKISELTNNETTLKDENESLKAKVEALEKEINANKEKEIVETIENSLSTKKVDDVTKSELIELGKASGFDKVKNLINALPNKEKEFVSLTATTATNTAIANERANWDLQDWSKNDPIALEQIYNNDKELFKKLTDKATENRKYLVK
jgi:ATP-dependent Clp protease protease subunit